MRRLSQDIKIVPILASAAGSTSRNSEVIDCRGWGACVIAIHFSAIAGDLTTIKLQHSNAASDQNTLTNAVDIADSSVTVLAAGAKYRVFDVIPSKRYLRVTVGKNTGSTTESGTAILYHGRVRPTGTALGTSAIGEGTDATSRVVLGQATDAA